MKRLLAALAVSTMTLGAVAVTTPVAMAQAGQSMVVVFDADKVFTDSMVGKDIQAKLTAIQTQIQTELRPDAEWVRNENAALAQATQGLTPQQIQQRADLRPRIEAYATREQDLQRKTAIAAREYQATEAKALQDFSNQLRTVVTAAAQARGASIVVERSTIYHFVPTVDITTDVTNRLNAAVTTMNVVRQRMPQQPAAQAPAPAAQPAAPARPRPQ